MKISTIDFLPVSIPYRNVEMSSRISRGGVTDVVVRMRADDGRIGWGECCSGADTRSVLAAAEAMAPFLIGRDPRDGQILHREIFRAALWDYRIQTGNFAYAGLDMAMLDLSAQEAGVPLWRLLGGRASIVPISYFCYLHRDTEAGLSSQCEEAIARGYEFFYLKVGLDPGDDERMLRAIRGAIGPGRKLRIDANEAWSVSQAIKLIERWDGEFDLDFVEAPISARPVRAMVGLRSRLKVALCANEGLGSEQDALAMIHADAADVLCFSSFWVGTMQSFLSLGRVAGLSGIRVCKHTHGEFGIAAAAHHHALLALGSGSGGHQQTASVLTDDILVENLPIESGPLWGEIEAVGLGINIDPEKLNHYHRSFLDNGQFLPWAGKQEHNSSPMTGG